MCKSLWTWHSSSVYFRLLCCFCGGCLLNQTLLNTLKTSLWTWSLWAHFIDKLKEGCMIGIADDGSCARTDPSGYLLYHELQRFFRSISVSENQKPDNLGDKRVLTRDTRHSAGNCWRAILVTTSDLLDPDDNRLLCQGYPTPRPVTQMQLPGHSCLITPRAWRGEHLSSW